MGSGEMAPPMVATHRSALDAAAASEVVILDTPFGFQENVEQLTDKLVEFFRTSLSVSARVASLRSLDTTAIDVGRFRNTLSTAAAVFAGPGSPSYALEVWREHDAGPLLRGVMERGGTVTLASAAALTAGTRTIPVYEIYKVGRAPHWLPGLDLLAWFGLRAVIVPHWNNAEGGNHDTSRCYIGERRFSVLASELDHGVIGVDEHTAVTFDLAEGVMRVSGKGTATLLGADQRVLESGEHIALTDLAPLVGATRARPGTGDPEAEPAQSFQEALRAADVDGVIRAMLAIEQKINDEPALRPELRSMIVQLGDAAGRGLVDPRAVVGGFIDLLLELRRDAREARRFDESDRIRQGLAELGIEVRDTTDGVSWDIAAESQNP